LFVLRNDPSTRRQAQLKAFGAPLDGRSGSTDGYLVSGSFPSHVVTPESMRSGIGSAEHRRPWPSFAISDVLVLCASRRASLRGDQPRLRCACSERRRRCRGSRDGPASTRRPAGSAAFHGPSCTPTLPASPSPASTGAPSTPAIAACGNSRALGLRPSAARPTCRRFNASHARHRWACPTSTSPALPSRRVSVASWTSVPPAANGRHHDRQGVGSR
jgi:hypothetical protein